MTRSSWPCTIEVIISSSAPVRSTSSPSWRITLSGSPTTWVRVQPAMAWRSAGVNVYSAASSGDG